MCGIAGILQFKHHAGRNELHEISSRMSDSIIHRGPDGAGQWVDPEGRVAFGHRRLAVIDLSITGHQPMTSTSGTQVISYNGEIYNFNELRNELISLGRKFRGTSDTEVILEACDTWGVEDTARRINGMFAFAIWDKRQRSLFLVRDRLGIKPLYYYADSNNFIFGSEIKALLASDLVPRKLNHDAVALYMNRGYVPQPHSIFEDVRKLEPGTVLKIRQDGAQESSCYWNLKELTVSGAQEEHEDNLETELIHLEEKIQAAVECRMVADVKLGAFLSGGIDSSLIAALMQRASSKPVSTFSIGFSDRFYDESEHARNVAEYLGTDHTELVVTSGDALNIVDKLAHTYDEPFADYSQIPTMLLSTMTKKHVTVALSGDGGDELFGGYSRFENALGVRRLKSRLPGSTDKLLASCLEGIPDRFWNGASELLQQRSRKLSNLSGKIAKLAHTLRVSDDEAYIILLSQWEDCWPLRSRPREVAANWALKLLQDAPVDYLRRMQYFEMSSYMVDDILTKVDRASMAASLEVRVPLLDYKVVEHSLGIPRGLKIRNGVGKHVLRELLYRHVPRSLVDRPKQGFQIPLADWLRGPLREWAEDLLLTENFDRQGLFDSSLVSRKWGELVRGEKNWQSDIWNLLMFQIWNEKWRPSI